MAPTSTQSRTRRYLPLLPAAANTARPAQLNLEALLPWLVAAVALALAIGLAAQFWDLSRHLWHKPEHDRHTHYELGLNLALDLRHGDLAALRHHLNGARVWGPLHGILVGLVQLVVGPDYRWGILPSLLAFAATVVLGYLITRRLLAEGGAAAGLLAAVFILVSPAHRAFATDIMLESLGAALTLLCLLRYLIAVQGDEPHRGRWLGISLSLLFFTKSNYWLIVVLGLLAAEALRRWPLPMTLARRAWQAVGHRAWLRQQALCPWNYVILALLIPVAWIALTGGGALRLFGHEVVLTEGYNLIGGAYAALVARLVLWWRRERIQLRVAAAGPVARGLVYWHILPVAIYFLLPKRLGTFLWFVSPANADQAASGLGLFRGLAFYGRAFALDYHVHAWLCLGVLGLAVLTPLLLRRWRPGALGVAMFLVVAALATAQHPMLKNRFAHTWTAVFWVLASAALVHCIYAALKAWPRWRFVLAVGLPAALFALHAPDCLRPGRSQEGGPRLDRPSILSLVDAYLPALAHCRAPTLLCNVYSPSFLSWTYQEFTGLRNFATEIKRFGAERPDLDAVKHWAKTTSSDALLLIEIEPGSAFHTRTHCNVDLSRVRCFLAGHSTGFVLARDWSPAPGVRLTLWRKA